MSRERTSAETDSLASLGWSPAHEEWWQDLPAHERATLEPGRVMKELRGVLEVRTANERLDTRIPGRFYQLGNDESEIPTIGDWVLVPRQRQPGDCWIEQLAPRTSKFSRQKAGAQTREQVVSANIDDLIIVMALDGDFNVRRLERFLSAAHESGATPVIVLNKADRVDSPAELKRAYQAVANAAGDTTIYVLSAVADVEELITAASDDRILGLSDLRARLEPGRTIAFVGSSGVGKSTIVNTLFGEEVMQVRAVRARDDRGQHTTSHREILPLPGGSLLVDNPGIRELQGWQIEDGLDEAFDEIRDLASECRFRDCRHEQEPGCAVRQAVLDGRLDAKRLQHFRALDTEARRQEERLAERERARESLHSRARKDRKRGRRRR